MKSGWRILIAAAAAAQLAFAGPALAQNAITPGPAAQETDVGPPQLRDFTLNGTVTRPGQTQPPAQPAPTTEAPAAQAPRPAPSPPPTTARPSATVELPRAAPPAGPGSVTVDLPPPSPSAQLPPASIAPIDEPTAGDPSPAMMPAPPAAMGQGPSLFPWLLAAMLVGAGAAFYVFRIRPRAQLAGGMLEDELRAPEAPPKPAPGAAPAPAPRAAVSPGGGIVSTRLRPWIEIEFEPQRTIVDDERVAIEFMLALYNSGSAPARDVLIEAGLFNASPNQDQQIGAFFANPVGRGERIPSVAPLQRIAIRSAVTLPRSQVCPLEVEGRSLLVPLAGFNALYRWGSNGEGQSSVSFLVGKQTESEKLAPFRLDLGPRVFRKLAAREHQLRVRK